MAGNGNIGHCSLAPFVFFLAIILSLLVINLSADDSMRGKQRPRNGDHEGANNRSETNDQSLQAKKPTGAWGEKLFNASKHEGDNLLNASKHEVPSGPNPVSNR